MTKQMIDKEAAYGSNLEGHPISDLIRQLQEIEREYGPTAYFETRCVPYEDDVYTALIVPTLETDEEYAERIARENSRLRRIEEYERAEYERLAAKFGATR